MKDLLGWCVIVPLAILAVVLLLLVAALTRVALGAPLNNSIDEILYQ